MIAVTPIFLSLSMSLAASQPGLLTPKLDSLTIMAAAQAREGDIAIMEEYEAARSKDTAAAYELFIARHPDHHLTKYARWHLQQTTRSE